MTATPFIFGFLYSITLGSFASNLVTSDVQRPSGMLVSQELGTTGILPLELEATGIDNYVHHLAQDSTEQLCARAVAIILPSLIESFAVNDFTAIETKLNTWEALCGLHEIIARARIVNNIIARKESHILIQRYFDKQFPYAIESRFDDASRRDYASLYQSNPAHYQYTPLRHALDSVLQVKTNALLASNLYLLSEKEELICLLFSDQMEAFYARYTEPYIRPAFKAESIIRRE